MTPLSPQAPLAPEEAWGEDGETLWLRLDLAATRAQARYLAWKGRRPGYVLEGEPFRYSHELTDLDVKKVWMREHEHGPYGEPWFYPCAETDPGAVAFWRVQPRRRGR